MSGIINALPSQFRTPATVVIGILFAVFAIVIFVWGGRDVKDAMKEKGEIKGGTLTVGIVKFVVAFIIGIGGVAYAINLANNLKTFSGL